MAKDAAYRHGQRLLEDLLPWARAEVRKGDHKTEMASALGKSAATYITEDNLDAILIYGAPKGGWHGDVVLKSTPPGVPNAFGTRVEDPCRTRAEAEDTAKHILVSLLQIAEGNKAPPAKPVFMLCGWTIELVPELYDIALKIMPDMRNGYGTQLQAAVRVEETLEQLCPEGFDGQAFNRWPQEKKAALVAVLHTAALSGLYVWPWRRDAAPKEAANV